MDNNIQSGKDSSSDLLDKMKAIGDKCVDELNLKIKGKQFSDVIVPQDENNPQELQFVNLVQEGGGVWGIALVGYTYVLERMGIRFLKLAGTSAGAINTMVMAGVGERAEAKSDKILKYLVEQNFSEFIDGHPIAKSFIRWFIFQKNAGNKILNSLLYMIIASIGFMFVGAILMWGRPNGILSLEIWLVITAITFWFGYDLYIGIFNKGLKETEERQNVQNIVESHHKSDVNKRIVGFIGVLMAFLFILYLISYYSKTCLNIQVWTDFLLVFGFFVFSIGTCFQKNSFVFPIQLLGSFVSGVVVVITIMHLNNFYPIEQILGSKTNTPPLSTTPYLHTSSLGISLFIMLVGYFGGLAFFLYKRFEDRSFGINPGKNFRDWIAEILRQNSTSTLEDLITKFNQPIDKITHRNNNISINDLTGFSDPKDNEPAVCLISGEIYTNTKIEFPKMAPMFWEDTNRINLADFVRASMSIPIFFEAFRRLPADIPESNTGKAMRRQYMAVGELKEGNLIDIEKHKGFAFMDGGIISNFPINKFFKPVANARMPTFGVMLNDPYSTPSDSLSGIIGSIFNTSRKHYDRSFLAEHEFYKQCLTNIDVKDINWLNFELDDEDKLTLFRQGAEAAREFLTNFCWCKYKKERDTWVQGYLNQGTINNTQNGTNFQNCNPVGCVYADNCICNDNVQKGDKTSE